MQYTIIANTDPRNKEIRQDRDALRGDDFIEDIESEDLDLTEEDVDIDPDDDELIEAEEIEVDEDEI
ncbi:MAG: hypothetical protein JWQ78_1904 [Sediminibacterium sp.]|nr:hypothetical protein [Sediminibacterium sp.]